MAETQTQTNKPNHNRTKHGHGQSTGPKRCQTWRRTRKRTRTQNPFKHTVQGEHYLMTTSTMLFLRISLLPIATPCVNFCTHLHLLVSSCNYNASQPQLLLLLGERKMQSTFVFLCSHMSLSQRESLKTESGCHPRNNTWPTKTFRDNNVDRWPCQSTG